jgi:hypothetical protein
MVENIHPNSPHWQFSQRNRAFLFLYAEFFPHIGIAVEGLNSRDKTWQRHNNP